MTTIATDAEKRARKEHQAAANQAGLRAMLERGRLMDEENNRSPVVRNVRSAAEILREAREVAESIPIERIAHVIACAECDEVIAEIESMQEHEEEEENATKTVEEQLAEAKVLLERLSKQVEKENSTE